MSRDDRPGRIGQVRRATTRQASAPRRPPALRGFPGRRWRQSPRTSPPAAAPDPARSCRAGRTAPRCSACAPAPGGRASAPAPPAAGGWRDAHARPLRSVLTTRCRADSVAVSPSADNRTRSALEIGVGVNGQVVDLARRRLGRGRAAVVLEFGADTRHQRGDDVGGRRAQGAERAAPDGWRRGRIERKGGEVIQGARREATVARVERGVPGVNGTRGVQRAHRLAAACRRVNGRGRRDLRQDVEQSRRHRVIAARLCGCEGRPHARERFARPGR